MIVLLKNFKINFLKNNANYSENLLNLILIRFFAIGNFLISIAFYLFTLKSTLYFPALVLHLTILILNLLALLYSLNEYNKYIVFLISIIPNFSWLYFNFHHLKDYYEHPLFYSISTFYCLTLAVSVVNMEQEKVLFYFLLSISILEIFVPELVFSYLTKQNINFYNTYSSILFKTVYLFTIILPFAFQKEILSFFIKKYFQLNTSYTQLNRSYRTTSLEKNIRSNIEIQLDKLKTDVFSTPVDYSNHELKINKICKEACILLNADIVSVWLLSNKDEILNYKTHFEVKNTSYTVNKSIKINEYPKYISSLISNNFLAIKDTLTNNTLTDELVKNYCYSKKTKSNFDIAFYCNKQFTGILRVEYFVSKSNWNNEEIVYIQNLATILAELQLELQATIDKKRIKILEDEIADLNSYINYQKNQIFEQQAFTEKLIINQNIEIKSLVFQTEVKLSKIANHVNQPLNQLKGLSEILILENPENQKIKPIIEKMKGSIENIKKDLETTNLS